MVYRIALWRERWGISVRNAGSGAEKLGNLPALLGWKLLPSQVPFGENTHAWLFCVPSEAEVASSDLRVLDVTSSGFWGNHSKWVSLWSVMCLVCIWRKQTVTIRFYKAKAGSQWEKKKLCRHLPLLTYLMKKKLLKASFFSLSIFPVSGSFRYSFLNFLTNVFFVIFCNCKCIKAKRKERWSNVKLFEITFLTGWRKWSMNRKVVLLHWWNWSRSTIIIVCVCYLTVNWLLLWIVYDFKFLIFAFSIY